MLLNRSVDARLTTHGSPSWSVCGLSNAALGCLCGEVAWASEVDERSAEPLSYLEGNSFVLYVLLIIVLFIVLEIVLYLIRRRKGKRGRYEGPDYIQYRRRI